MLIFLAHFEKFHFHVEYAELCLSTCDIRSVAFKTISLETKSKIKKSGMGFDVPYLVLDLNYRIHFEKKYFRFLYLLLM